MAGETVRVEVVSAEQTLLSVEAEAVYARSLEGEIGILPRHQPALLALDIAPLKVVTVEGDDRRVACHNGFLYYRGDKLVVLADMAETAEQIDPERARRRRGELEDEHGSEPEDREPREALRREEVRLDVAEG